MEPTSITIPGEKLPEKPNQILEFIKKHYAPADPQTADIFVSTQDLLSKLEAHLCVDIYPDQLLTVLEEFGFTYFDMDSMGFVWTLRKLDRHQDGNEG